MKTLHFRRNSNAFVGILVATAGFVSCAMPDDSVPEEDSFIPDGFASKTETAQDRILLIRYLLEEKYSMINLFKDYGLLSAPELQNRIQEIEEVTESHIESLIGPGRKVQWFDSSTGTSREEHRLDRVDKVAGRVYLPK